MNTPQGLSLEVHLTAAIPWKCMRTLAGPLLRLLLRSKWSALIIHWTFQGLLNMDRTERTFKIITDLILTVLLWAALRLLMAEYIALIIAVLTAHTVNLILNGQIPIMLLHYNVHKYSHNDVIDYIDSMRFRLAASNEILAAGIWGGISRGEVEDYPDVDLRVFRKKGFINGIKACYTMMKERTRALLNCFPLDAFLSDSWRHIERLRQDEVPVLLYDPACFIKERYAPAKEWSTVYNTKNKKDTL